MSAKRRTKRPAARRNLLPAPATEAAAVRAAHLANGALVVAEGEEAGLQQGTVQARGYEVLAAHYHCREIRRADDPYRRMIGFSCTCSGREQQWQVSLTDMRIYDGQTDGALACAMQAIEYAEETWEGRQQIDVRDYREMARMVSAAARRRRDWYDNEERQREKARKVARKLLRQNVSPEAWREFLRRKEFHVTGSDGRLYRISHQIGSNVTLVVNGVDVARFCVVPKEHAWIPEPDMMLAVKLMLETNARSFIQKANRTELRPTG